MIWFEVSLPKHFLLIRNKSNGVAAFNALNLVALTMEFIITGVIHGNDAVAFLQFLVKHVCSCFVIILILNIALQTNNSYELCLRSVCVPLCRVNCKLKIPQNWLISSFRRIVFQTSGLFLRSEIIMLGMYKQFHVFQCWLQFIACPFLKRNMWWMCDGNSLHFSWFIRNNAQISAFKLRFPKQHKQAQPAHKLYLCRSRDFYWCISAAIVG